MESQFYLGDTGILVHPVVGQGSEKAEVYIAETEVSPCISVTDADLF
jgi:alpha-glucosidase (family GH31 glycosyl hydrolase)